MKKFFLLFALAPSVLFISCKSANNNEKDTAGKEETSYQLASDEAFKDTLNGKQVSIYYLRNSGIEAAVTNFGGRLINLMVPDKDGKMVDVVIGPENFNDMVKTNDYFGATIGRYGNRIANGEFTLDGVTYKLPKNNGRNNLHGGPKGFHNQVWDAVQPNDSTLELSYLSKDGEMGFPGNLQAKVVYTLTSNGEMKIEYEATTDKPTVCNLTNHTYFNLNGGGTINNHLLQINADEYTPVDSTLIPLGELAPVKGTPFDFTTPTAIGARVDEDNEQLKYGLGYDHNFVVKGEANTLRQAAKVTGDLSGITMEIFSTEPGIQFYGGNFMKGTKPMKRGTKDEYRTAFCLEPQHFPNSPNVPSYPSTTLRPGEVYKTVSVYKFSK